MTLQEFKKQRAALVSKLAFLAIEINEQGKYYANCDIVGHVNWVNIQVYQHIIKNDLNVEIKFYYDKMHQPYSSMSGWELSHEGADDQYELIIADLQNSYNEMLKYLEA